jgi:hypothetical protein
MKWELDLSSATLFSCLKAEPPVSGHFSLSISWPSSAQSDVAALLAAKRLLLSYSADNDELAPLAI